MTHYVVLTKRNPINLSLQPLDILELWFKISKTRVKWERYFSSFFELVAGTRQEGVLSPLLFAIFMDNIVESRCGQANAPTLVAMFILFVASFSCRCR
jgi:hypothetical protein